MAIIDVVDEYFTYEIRLASFQNAQQLSKRRASNANNKAPKSLKWPHKWMSPDELAKAGFFYCPTQASPDNVACFLCHRNIDGWEDGDDPLVEHLRHSPNCGWAIVTSVGRNDGDSNEEYPNSARMIEARKATFADKWPHESKRGWKCKVKQMVEAGWKYTPSPESDDMATCTYCDLMLDGWENGDKPLDEHFNRSPECAFFTLINNHINSPAMKRTKSKKTRASKASRLSTQSAFTVVSDAPSFVDLPAEEGDSILTTATNATVTTQSGSNMGKGKKAAAGKGRKTKAKKDGAVEVADAPKPEYHDFEMQVEVAPKPTRGRKRKTDETVDLSTSSTGNQPPTKRRTTRARASTAIEESVIISPEESIHSVAVEGMPKPKGRKKGRSSVARTTRKVSATAVANLSTQTLDDDEIDAALEADLERHLTDEEELAEPPQRGTRSSKITKADHAMFSTESLEVHDAAIELELQAMAAESKTLPKARGAKAKQPRKVSAKQQVTAKRIADVEAQRVAEEEASQQTAAKFEQSLSMQQSSPAQPQKQTTDSRRAPGRSTGASVMVIDDSIMETTDEFHDAIDDQKNDSGNETDASMASQSTIVRGGPIRRGSTMKKGRDGENRIIRNIEEIVRRSKGSAAKTSKEDLPIEEVKEHELIQVNESGSEKASYGHSPEAPAPIAGDTKPKATKPKAIPRGRGRPAKVVSAAEVQDVQIELEPMKAEPARPKSSTAKGTEVALPPSATPPPEENTPQSPQSSDAENHPPSAKPSASTKKPTTPDPVTKRIPLEATTPVMSPSKRNILAGLQSAHPWTAVDLDAIFLKSPGDENTTMGLLGEAMQKAKNGDLTSPEKKMTVEEWIHYNAEVAEEKLRSECERMVGTFEREGGRAMWALEGVECIE